MHPILTLLIGTAPTTQSPAPVRLVREFTIDASSGVSFGNIARIDLGPDGSIVAVDDGNGVIYRFTPGGRLRDSLGHKGQGPGEFQLAAGMAVGPAGEVAIADMRNRRLTIWNADGQLRGSAPLTSGLPIDLLWRGARPVVGVVTFNPSAGPTALYREVSLADSAPGRTLGTFPDPSTPQMAQAVSCGMCPHGLTPGGSLLVAAPDTFYRVSELAPDGSVLRSWKRSGIGAGSRTEEEAAALKARIARGPGGGRPLPNGMKLPVPGAGDLTYRWRFQGIGLDGAGRLLALVSNAGSTSPVVDVFAGDGRFLGTVKPAEALKAMVVRGNRVLALGETADGEHLLHVYRIEAAPGQ